jgi:uncharacterized protein YndB with AHSA1/START domain
MNMLKGLIVGFVVLLALFVGISFFLPREVAISRSIVIAKPQAEVFAYLNGFKHFNEWSPWAELDPAARYSFSGPETGVGASMRWESEDPNVGKGEQTIVGATAPEEIRIALVFGDEQQASDVRQRLTPEGEGTRVEWSMRSDMGMNPLYRWFGLAFESLVGPDYEKGLAKMKTVLEARLPAPAPEAAPADAPVAPPA